MLKFVSFSAVAICLASASADGPVTDQCYLETPPGNERVFGIPCGLKPISGQPAVGMPTPRAASSGASAAGPRAPGRPSEGLGPGGIAFDHA